MIFPTCILANQPSPNVRGDGAMHSLSFQACEVVVWSDDYIETVFSDGAVAPALFSYTEQDRQLAMAIGYGDDVRQMHREHDVAHTFLAEMEGDSYSPVLRGIATHKPLMGTAREREETKVLMFQRYVCTGETHPSLAHLSLPVLAKEFRTLIKKLWVNT